MEGTDDITKFPLSHRQDTFEFMAGLPTHADHSLLKSSN